jgi:hypothetical protein
MGIEIHEATVPVFIENIIKRHPVSETILAKYLRMFFNHRLH